MAGKPPKIKYIQLEPGAFLSDEDFQLMTDAERGIYCTIIFYMLCNNGRIRNDPEAIKRLCNVTQNWEPKWATVLPKLYPKRAFLRHRRVDSELRKARERAQLAVESGLKGAQKRWGAHKGSYDSAIGNGIANETKRNISKYNNTNNEIQSSGTIEQDKIQDARKRISSKISSSRPSLRFAEQLEKILPPKNKSDRKAYLNLIHWLVERIDDGQLSDNAYNVVLDFARKSKTGQNPIAVFFDTLKKEIGYRVK